MPSPSRTAAPDLSGVMIPVLSPFLSGDGDLDLAGFRANLRRWLAHPIRGIVVAGSTGEAILLEDEERLALLDLAREEVPGDRLLLAGTGSESLRGTIRRTREAAERGADAALVKPPAFFRGLMTPAVLRDHYWALADASPIPIVLYQVPLRFSTLDFPTGLIAELSQHPNIIGIKDSRGDMQLLGQILDQARSDFQVLVGTGARLYAALQLGAVGGILGVANLVPGESARIVAAFRAGEHEAAGVLQERVSLLHDGIVGAHGVPGVKAALELLGGVGGAPRLPLPPLGETGRSQVAQCLREGGLALS
jgi:4-hydroxy-2-oxoglutarate aldolase